MLLLTDSWKKEYLSFQPHSFEGIFSCDYHYIYVLIVWLLSHSHQLPGFTYWSRKYLVFWGTARTGGVFQNQQKAFQLSLLPGNVFVERLGHLCFPEDTSLHSAVLAKSLALSCLSATCLLHREKVWARKKHFKPDMVAHIFNPSWSFWIWGQPGLYCKFQDS